MFKVGDMIRCGCEGKHPCPYGIENSKIIRIDDAWYHTDDGAVPLEYAERPSKSKPIKYISYSPVNKPYKEKV